MRNLNAAAEAACHARRLREAAQAVITGNVAFAICLLGAVLVVAHSDRIVGAPFVMCGLAVGYLTGLIFSLRWMTRQRARSLATVVAPREVELRTTTARPWRSAAFLFMVFAFQAMSLLVWRVVLPRLSTQAILMVLAVTPVLGLGFFVRRYLLFRFWEDLLFAACVVLAYVPFFLSAWALTPLSFLALLMVVAGAISLNGRWTRWTHSLGNEAEDGEARP